MDVFVTGATGHLGSAVVTELLEVGHRVTGLARSDAGAAALTAKGATPHRGDLDDLDGLRAAAAASDGVIHLAYRHDFDSDFVGAAQTDLRVVEAMGEVLAGSDRPLVNTSGTLLLALFAQGRVATENDTAEGGPRIDSENATIALAERGVRSSVIRLSPLGHSTLDHHGFAHRLIHTARDKGARFRDIAGVIGRHLDVPVVSISAEEAGDHFGFLSVFASFDNPTSSALTQKVLDWHPEGPGLIEDLDAGHYFGE